MIQRCVQEPATDAGSLQVGAHSKQRQEPQRAAPQRQCDADHFAVQLGHDAATGVCRRQVLDAAAGAGGAGGVARPHREAVLAAGVVEGVPGKLLGSVDVILPQEADDGAVGVLAQTHSSVTGPLSMRPAHRSNAHPPGQKLTGRGRT